MRTTAIMIKKHFYSWADIEKMCVSIVNQMYADNWRPDYIVGITRGGLIPAVLMSHYTGIKMHTLDVRLRDGDHDCETNTWMAEDAGNGRKILVLDDINDTGETFKWIKQDWEGSVVNDIAWGNDVRFAAIIDNIPSEMDVEYSSMEINKMEDPSWIVFPFEEWW